MKIKVLLVLAVAVLSSLGCTPGATPSITSEPTVITLPEPRLTSEVSVEEALVQRRSVREYSTIPLLLDEVSQLLWAAQGITSEWGGRTAPSAGALYPLEVYLAVGNVDGLAPAVYRYDPKEHGLVMIKDEDVRGRLADAALGQNCVEHGAIDIVVAAVYERTTKKYGYRGVRYVHMEAGHAAQNIYLQATALDLGVVTVGAFNDSKVRAIIGMGEDEVPLYVIPVGNK